MATMGTVETSSMPAYGDRGVGPGRVSLKRTRWASSKREIYEVEMNGKSQGGVGIYHQDLH